MKNDMRAKVVTTQKAGEWTAVATVTRAGKTSEHKGTGVTLSTSLRELADAMDLYFEHNDEQHPEA